MKIVVLQALEKTGQGQSEAWPGLFVIVVRVFFHAAFDVVANPLEQGVKQIFFVFEMPIQRAARYACGLGDFVERGAGNAFLIKRIQCGKHEIFFGF